MRAVARCADTVLGILASVAPVAVAGMLCLWYLQQRPTILGEFHAPFLFPDGSRVRDRADWEARRDQIKDLLARVQYGRMAEARSPRESGQR